MIDSSQFADRTWRLNNLYHIIDKRGVKLKFKLNWAQQKLYDDLWYCNIILKARQLGISTFVSILFLDATLWNPNTSAGIICHTREDAEILFRKIKYAYDQLLPSVKEAITARTDTARELVFNNNSSIRVGTSMRGSTLQYLHISEFGKICASFPDKAEEIISGSLNTLAPGQFCFIESTAEGREGYFYELCKKAENARKMDHELSKIDFKFHFFPWYEEPSYRIGSPVGYAKTSTPTHVQEYFESLEMRGICLDQEQKNWYRSRYDVLQETMLREFPSTADEAWEQSNEGLYYGRLMSLARVEKRVTTVPYDPSLEVHTAWDLGYNDATAIVFFQVYRKEIRIIDYLEGDGESLSHWLALTKSKGYNLGKMLAPHDIMVHELSTGMTRQQSARKMGVNFIPVKRHEIINGIDHVRNCFPRFWIDEKKCDKLIKALDAYKKEWDDKHGCWRSKPLHNWASHGADSIRYLCMGLDIIEVKKETDGTTLGGGRRIW